MHKAFFYFFLIFPLKRFPCSSHLACPGSVGITWELCKAGIILKQELFSAAGNWAGIMQIWPLSYLGRLTRWLAGRQRTTGGGQAIFQFSLLFACRNIHESWWVGNVLLSRKNIPYNSLAATVTTDQRTHTIQQLVHEKWISSSPNPAHPWPALAWWRTTRWQMQTHRNTDTRCALRAEMQSRRWYAERSSEEPRRVVCWILQASLPPHVTTAMYALCSEQHTAVLLTKYSLCAFCSDAGSCQAPCPRHGNSFEAQKNIIAELKLNWKHSTSLCQLVLGCL